MSDIYRGAPQHNHIDMGEDFVEHHGVLGMKWGVRRYQSYSEVPRKSGKGGKETGEAHRMTSAEKRYTRLEKKAAKADFKASKTGFGKDLAKFDKADKKAHDAAEKAVESRYKADEKIANKVSKWQSRENARVEHEYSKSINKYEKLANKYLDKYDAAKPSRKEGYAKSYVQAKNYANIERGKLSAEKSFIKNATISDIKHERNQLIKGAATCAALSGVMGVVSAGTMLPVTILVMPKPSAIKTANRIDSKQQKSIEAKAAKTTVKSAGSTSKEIQRQYQEDLKRRRRAMAESQRAAQQASQRAAQSAALQSMSLGASGGTNPFMFGM